MFSNGDEAIEYLLENHSIMIYLTHWCFYWEASDRLSEVCSKKKIEIYYLYLCLESYIKSRQGVLSKLFSRYFGRLQSKGGITHGNTHIVSWKGTDYVLNRCQVLSLQ